MSWNVRGHARTLHESAFARGTFRRANIICLTETGAHAPDIGGFTLIKHAVRERATQAGGVAVLVRSSLVDQWGVKLVSGPEHHDSGMVCVALSITGCRPVHIACCYLPHDQSRVHGRDTNTRKAAIAELYNTLTDLRAQAAGADFVVTGDLNAHTGQHSETDLQEWDSDTPPEVLDYVRTMHLVQTHHIRASEDNKTDFSGRALLSFCADSRLAILNGRLSGDEEGRITYQAITHPIRDGVQVTQVNQSVVDYALLT